MERPHFQALDSLRGLAALGVVLLHIGWIYPGFYLQPIRHMGLMVDFFFVLSGFVIAINYGARLVRGKDEFWRFIWLRFWRLYPLHFVMLLVFAGIETAKYIAQVRYGLSANYPAFQASNLNAFVMNLLLAQSLHTTAGVSFNEPSWSISTEFYTYILFAIAVAIFGAGRGLLLASIAIMGVSLVLLLTAPVESFALICTSHFGIFRCTLGFFLGVVLVHVFRKMERFELSSYLKPLSWVAVLSVLIVLILPDGYTDLAIYPLVGILILSLALLRHDRMTAILGTRPLLWLGRVSYSIYMVHYAVTWSLTQVLRFGFKVPQTVYPFEDSVHEVANPPVWLGIAFAILAIGLTLALSQLTFAWIEEPFRLWSKRPRHKFFAVADR